MTSLSMRDDKGIMTLMTQVLQEKRKHHHIPDKMVDDGKTEAFLNQRFIDQSQGRPHLFHDILSLQTSQPLVILCTTCREKPSL